MEISFLTHDNFGSHYLGACHLFGLDPTDAGYAFLHCVDGDGRRSTRATTDIEFARMIASNTGTTSLLDVEIPGEKFPIFRSGWPEEWLGPKRSMVHPGPWIRDMCDDSRARKLTF